MPRTATRATAYAATRAATHLRADTQRAHGASATQTATRNATRNAAHYSNNKNNNILNCAPDRARAHAGAHARTHATPRNPLRGKAAPRQPRTTLSKPTPASGSSGRVGGGQLLALVAKK